MFANGTTAELITWLGMSTIMTSLGLYVDMFTGTIDPVRYATYSLLLPKSNRLRQIHVRNRSYALHAIRLLLERKCLILSEETLRR